MANDNPESGIGKYDKHDQAVMRRINNFIALANVRCAGCTVAEKLEKAWSDNIRDREDHGTTDTVGRDADYYFASRHEIAAQKGAVRKEATAVLGTIATAIYIGLKAATAAVGADRIMRTDPDKPNAPPGGFIWEQRGEADGKKDLGDTNGPALFHHPN